MQKFIKDKIDDCPSSETILLILKRFEHLHLDCLCLDRRYLDVAVIFEKELDELKDMLVEIIKILFLLQLINDYCLFIYI